MRSASTARQPVSASSASSAPMSQEAPTTPPAPRTRPTRMRRTVPGSTDCQPGPFGRREGEKGAPEQEKRAIGAGGRREDSATHSRTSARMTAQGATRGAETPRMLLVFEGMGADEPIRPVQVAAVLSSLEEIFLVTLLRDAPPPDHLRREWVWDYDAQSDARRARGPEARIAAAGPARAARGTSTRSRSRPSRTASRTSSARPPAPRRCSIARARTSGAAASPASSPKRRVDGVAGVARVQARGGGAHRAVPASPRSTSR